MWKWSNLPSSKEVTTDANAQHSHASSILLDWLQRRAKIQGPEIPASGRFLCRETSISTSSAADLAWWELFKDPVLQGLIREALTNNYDLRLAVSRVEQERALLGVTRSQYYPQVGYDGSISGQQSPLLLRTTPTIPTTSPPSGKLTCLDESAS